MVGVEALLLLAALAALLYLLGSWNHSYWRDRGVPGPAPALFFGTAWPLILPKMSYVDFFRSLYSAYPDSPYVGLLGTWRPSLLLRDPELIKHVLTRDFEYFHDRGMPFHERGDPLSGNLFRIEGVRWKSLRAKLTPTFTSGKLRRMFPLMQECGRQLLEVLRDPASRADAIDAKELLARFTTDVIGTCTFGVECNTLKNPDAEFRRCGLEVFKISMRVKMRNVLLSLFPKVYIMNRIFSLSGVHGLFRRVIRENIKFREEHQVERNDYLDLLTKIRNKGKLLDDDVDVIQDPYLKVPVSASSEELQFTEDAMLAQIFVFFAAGLETSSTTVSLGLFELAHHPQIQQQLQQEVDTVLKKHRQLTYEALQEMPYLDKVISETLRKYFPLCFLTRVAAKPYRLPGSGLVLEAGTRVFVPVCGLHYDPAHYPHPDRFDPERFSAEAKAGRHPYTYLPFGQGPRNCIGFRFGLLQSKLGIAAVMSEYSVEPSPLTRYPAQFAKASITTTTEGGCHVTITQRHPNTAPII